MGLPVSADPQHVIDLGGERDVPQAQHHLGTIHVALEDREAVVLGAKPHPSDPHLAGEVVGRLLHGGGHETAF
jgi:hypothetical protein